MVPAQASPKSDSVIVVSGAPAEAVGDFSEAIRHEPRFHDFYKRRGQALAGKPFPPPNPHPTSTAGLPALQECKPSQAYGCSGQDTQQMTPLDALA